MSQYYTYTQRFDHICACLVLRLLTKLLHALRYFILYMFVSRMDTDQVLTALAIRRCREISWSKTTVTDLFVFYAFPTREDYCIKEEVVQARKRVGILDGSRRQCRWRQSL